MENVLSVNRLEKYYGNKGNVTKALNGLSLEMKKGEYVGVMGASGSGKTTLLNCIATIDRPTAGQITINGENVTMLKSKQLAKFRRDSLGFVFQDFNLLDTLTGFENIALALTMTRVHRLKIEDSVKEVASTLSIENILNKYPYQMSGGEKQRVAAARAIVSSPSLILADEPTGALDSKSSRQLLESFEVLNQKKGASILMVTHDAFTASYCHRIVFIKDGEVFTELRRGTDSRSEFFAQIIDVLTLLGGDNAHVL
ncbi:MULTISPECIES: ABC transporter ATP-binding protein [unclassified Fusibacter]|uniref:ABC transporter ATP-binding protein n=1 Tax=unclassified Fusibacter TaxID=2624464 RepID=UPI0010123451|nr:MULTISPECIES: ABC transporter ATP-binding protein [unclassified Fusibacter]MCK8058619.1 ABC transporter ATP-binding protein [Fusibacter sp. A2]NPE22611.1 ABC transporter ATP-binding protein [Fusibacter sp. A1]RXV60176.1 ABC transporter ATP-binding protein [Fusibacter sp. A1]